MAIEPQDYIKEYYEEVNNRYGLTFERFNAICRAPFIFFRKMMESMTFPLIHIKYFGKFVVYPGAAKKIIKGLEIARDNERITQEEFEIKSKPLKDHIKAYDDKKGDNPDSDRESSSD